MAEKLPVPNITIDENSTDYAAKIQQIADGQKTSVEAFNAQIDSGDLAEKATSKIAQEKRDAIVEIDSAVATAKAEVSAAQNASKKILNNAVAVSTGGTATLEPEAGKIPLSDADGVIDSKWIPASVKGQNAFATQRDSNEDKYAASGFVHMGKHHASDPVNEGLYVSESVPNAILLGRYDSNSPSGKSKSDVAVAVIAGIETTLDRLNVNGNYHAATIKLPDSPDGTVTCNNGKIIQHASAAEAFGGVVSNGDFRHGTDDWYFLNASMAVDSDGWATITSTTGYGRATTNMPTVPGVKYRLEAVIENTGDNLLLELTGLSALLTQNHLELGVQTVTYYFTADSAVTTLRCQVQEGVAGSIRIKFVSVMPSTEEVVTERVDMHGLEGYLEEITIAQPFVYPNGLIQSQASSMDGIATTLSNRPLTYYAVFDGDTSSKGKGVDWFASNDIDKGKMQNNPKNKIYWIDGKPYQWRVRQRSIAGAGNGDWSDVMPHVAKVMWNSNNRLKPQGIQNTIVKSLAEYNEDTYGWYVSTASSEDAFTSGVGTGHFSALRANTIHGQSYDVNGEYYGAFGLCCFLVMGTVPRLNQGAFFHGLNDHGTKPFRFSQSNPTFLGAWNVSGVNIFSKAQCFDLKSSSDAVNGALGASDYGGKIGTTSGRPDGRFYDAIYTGGLGGIIDYRLSAWDKSSNEEANKIDLKVKSGIYRGIEKLKRTQAIKSTRDNSQSSNDFVNMGEGQIPVQVSAGDIVYVQDFVGGGFTKFTLANIERDATAWIQLSGNHVKPINPIIVFEWETNVSVSGNFLTTDVLADTSSIINNLELKHGWLGSWLGLPSLLSEHSVALSRKVVDSLGQPRTWSEDGGITWSNATSVLDFTTNEMFVDNRHDITTLSYMAFAKQTRKSVKQAVYGGLSGVSDVSATIRDIIGYGNLFAESLIGKVLTSSWINVHSEIVSVTNSEINWGAGWLNYINHTPITIGQPINSSVGIKTLNYQIENNQQLGLAYVYEEMKWLNGIGWGNADIPLSINNNQKTITDDNGLSILAGTSELALPYGWSKNNV